MTQPTYDLYFQSLLFHQGINTTCRLGIKHYQALKDRDKNLILRLIETDTENSNIVYASFLNVECKHYSQVTATECLINHDPFIRDKNDLTEGMIDCYGDDFSTDSLITLITFDV